MDLERKDLKSPTGTDCVYPVLVDSRSPVFTKDMLIRKTCPIFFALADLELHGSLQKNNINELQKFCASARGSGEPDFQSFLDALNETGLIGHFTCEGCKYAR